MRTSPCKFCGTDIFFARHHLSGKLCAITAAPLRFGGKVVIREAEGGAVEYRVLKKKEPTDRGVQRFRLHFIECGKNKDKPA